MNRNILSVLLALSLLLGGGGCGTLRALWPGDDDGLPKPTELPDPRAQKERLSWLPKFSLPRPAHWFGRRDRLPGPAPDLSEGVALVENPALLEFHQRASSFYRQLAGRRFNTLTTYRDPALRDFFRSAHSHADYYADLTQALRFTAFAQNTPLRVELIEIRSDGPGRALVLTRIFGNNALPLRWWESELLRADRWERRDGTWWIVPSRL